MNTRQLQDFRTLIEFIKKIPEKHFDMDYFTYSSKKKSEGEIAKDLYRIGTELSPGDCGTVGCVIGFLPVCFPKDFYYSNRWSISDSFVEIVPWLTNAQIYGFEAAMTFFDISDEEASNLFDPGEYPLLDDNTYVTKTQVIERMENFLSEIQINR